MAQQFGSFTASELYCPNCKAARPVRERLLLVLPNGELHEFVCTSCSTTLGERTVTGPPITAPQKLNPQRPARGRGRRRVK